MHCAAQSKLRESIPLYFQQHFQAGEFKYGLFMEAAMHVPFQPANFSQHESETAAVSNYQLGLRWSPIYTHSTIS
jgi:hypothetical protein